MNENSIVEYVDSPEVKIIHNYLTLEEIDLFMEDTKSPEEVWELNWEHEYVGEAKKYTGWKGMAILLHTDRFLKRAHFDQQKYNNLLDNVQTLVEEHFNKKVKIESAQLTRWRVGRDQPPHIDYFIESEEHDYDELLKNHWSKDFAIEFGKTFNNKHYSAMLYLNEDFEGGELYFPQHNNFTLIPKPGMLILFEGNDKNFHGVTKVQSGIRYTISMFFTREDHVQ